MLYFFVLASRWKRLAGALIDGLIATIIVVPIMLATGVLQRAYNQQDMTLTEHILYFILGNVIFLILNGYLLYKKGQTIGKVAMNTRIVDQNGNIPSFAKIFVLRYFIIGTIAQIPYIGGIIGLTNSLFIFGKEKRCLHDYLAGTRVVNI